MTEGNRSAFFNIVLFFVLVAAGALLVGHDCMKSGAICLCLALFMVFDCGPALRG